MGTERNIPVKPPRLAPGDTIGIVAPASPFDQERFNKGVAVLESMGFRVSFDVIAWDEKRPAVPGFTRIQILQITVEGAGLGPEGQTASTN